MHTLSVLAFFLSFSAEAVPLEMSEQGRIFDGAGLALDGPHDLDFAIYDVPSGGVALWTGSETADFDNGYFHAPLTALDATVFDGNMRWMGMSVDGGAELPDRIAMVSVPYAIRSLNADTADTALAADTALSADAVAPGSVINASEIQIGGVTVIDAGGTIVGGALPGDTLGSLGCADGQLAIVSGSAWSCVDEGALVIDASQLTGTLDMARIPVGTSSATVSAGDHTHTHSHTAADVGAIPDAGGGILLGDPGATCTAAEAGLMRWTTGLEICDGTGWLTISADVGPGNGTDPTNAGTTCGTILAAFPGSADGVYWLDPDGTGTALEAYCDMTGGGWTMMTNTTPTMPDAAGVDFTDASFGADPCLPSTATDCGRTLSTMDFDEFKYVEVLSGGGTRDLIEPVAVQAAYKPTSTHFASMSVGDCGTLAQSSLRGDLCGLLGTDAYGYTVAMHLHRNNKPIDSYISLAARRYADNAQFTAEGCPTGWSCTTTCTNYVADLADQVSLKYVSNAAYRENVDSGCNSSLFSSGTLGGSPNGGQNMPAGNRLQIWVK